MSSSIRAPGNPPSRGGHSRRTGGQVLLALILLAPLAAPPAAQAKVFLTQEEALRLAFDSRPVQRHTFYLSPEQQKEAARSAGSEIPSALVVRYQALEGDSIAGYAYFEVHRVRTLAETVMIALDAAGSVRRVEVLSFDEPPEYKPREEWYAQFKGKSFNGDLAPNRAIRPVTGATLTARATTECVRRVLAVHRLLTP